jgi:hypothetical protein
MRLPVAARLDIVFCAAAFAALAGCSDSVTRPTPAPSVTPRPVARGTPNIALSTREINFQKVLIGHTRYLSLVVSNRGNGPLTVHVSPLLSPPFLADNKCLGRTLARGANCEITFGFAPGTAKAYRQTYTVESDDPDEPAVAVVVFGYGR